MTDALLILVVDDNFDHRFLTRRALKPLEEEGRVRLALAEDGEEALAKLRDGLRPDLVFLDIKMPRLDGFDVLRAMRAQPEHAQVPVIMFTSSENRTDVDRALALGADDYLTKPMDAREFQQRVREKVASWLARQGA